MAFPLRTLTDFYRAWFSRRIRPFKLTLHLTGRCNSRCGHCGIWKNETPADLPEAVIRRLFDRYPRFTWIDLSGGEIFMREDLVGVVASIVNRSPRLEWLHFPTNGLCEGTFERILEIRRIFKGRLVLSVSIDGDEALNDRIRGIPGSFRKATDLLRRLLEAEPSALSVYAGMTLYAANSDAVDRTLAAIRTRVPGFHSGLLHVNFAHAAAYYGNRDFFKPFQGDFNSLDINGRKGSPSPFSLLERIYRSLYGVYHRSGRTPVPCRSGEVSVTIDSRGVLRPCTMWDVKGIPLEDHGYDLGAALAQPAFRDLVSTIRRARCVHCFTPCEAYQTLLSSPVATLRAFLKETWRRAP